MSVDTGGRRAAQALLQASERLGPPPDLGRLRRRRRRRTASRAALAVAAVLVAVAVAVAGRAVPGLDWVVPDPAAPAATPPPGNPGPDAIDVGRADASELAAGASGVWLLNHHSGRRDELVRVDPGGLRVTARIEIGHSASTPAVGEDGSLFLVRPRNETRPDRPELVRVDPATNRVAATVALPPASRPYGATGLVATGGMVWVAYPGRGLVRVDPAARTTREFTAGGRLVGVDRLAVAGGRLWAANGRELHQVDPRDGTVEVTVSDRDLRAAMPPAALAGGAGGLWVHGFGPDGERLLRLDPASGRVQAVNALSERTDGRLVQVDLGADDRVVAIRSGSRLALADPGQGAVSAVMPAPGTRGAGMAVRGGVIWLFDPAKGRLVRIGPAVLGRP
jgi:hypothetical protein